MQAIPLEQQMQAAGLEVLGRCGPLSRWPGVLQASPLLQDLTAAEADLLGERMLLVQARPGQVLIQEGDASDWLLLLLRGTVDVVKRKVGAEGDHEDAGETTRLAVLREGAVVGEMSMFDGEPRAASCRALDDVEAAVLDRAAVAGLIRDRPVIAAKLLVKLTQVLAQRLRNTSGQLLRALRDRAR